MSASSRWLSFLRQIQGCGARHKIRHGNLENPTHCNDRPDFTVIVDKAVLQSGSLAKYRAAFFRTSRSS